MTRDEAIAQIKAIRDEASAYEHAVCYVTSEDAEALDMAIEALEIDQNNYLQKCDDSFYRGVEVGKELAETEEPKLTQDNPSLTQDCISRDSVIELVEIYAHEIKSNTRGGFLHDLDLLESSIKKLPSVQSEHTAEWIEHEDGTIFKQRWLECSYCHRTLDRAHLNAGRGNAFYCPNCGARMKGVE